MSNPSLFVGEIKDGELHIGQTTVPVYNPENKTKVPDVLFYENHQVRNVIFLFLLLSWLDRGVSYRIILIFFNLKNDCN